MNEIVEMIYYLHKGASVKGISQSLGFDRGTLRQYVRMAQRVGIDRDNPFPKSEEVVSKLKGFMDSAPQSPHQPKT